MSARAPVFVGPFETVPARLSDVEGLVSLRRTLLSQGNGHYAATSADADRAWQASYRTWLEQHLRENSPRIAVVVTRDARRRAVACATGIVDDRAPMIGSLNGLVGWVQSVVVVPELRQRGLARQTMDFLLRWFGEQGVYKIALQTTAEALPLYERLGFRLSGEDLLIRSSN